MDKRFIKAGSHKYTVECCGDSRSFKRYADARRYFHACGCEVKEDVTPLKEEDITIDDILEDAKDGVLKDKNIEAVKKIAKKKSK